MKTIIAGSRGIIEYPVIVDAIARSGFEITEVVSGCARGVDTLGEQWANDRNIPIKRFPAKWNLYQKAAGHIRNREMAEYADALIAIWDGSSPGTKSMIDIALGRGLHVFVINHR